MIVIAWLLITFMMMRETVMKFETLMLRLIVAVCVFMTNGLTNVAVIGVVTSDFVVRTMVLMEARLMDNILYMIMVLVIVVTIVIEQFIWIW